MAESEGQTSEKWAKNGRRGRTAIYLVCASMSLSVFSFFQDFFSCCVSQTVCVGDSPNDGEFVGLEDETFVRNKQGIES